MKKEANRKLYVCLSCQEGQCWNTYTTTQCKNAIQCWSSIALHSDGYVNVSRGCMSTNEELARCSPHHSESSNKNKYAGAYRITCCEGDYCNNASISTLLPSYTNKFDHEETSLIVVGMLLSIICIGLLCLQCIRKRNRKIRATAAVGNSTLKEYLKRSNTSKSAYSLMSLLAQRSLVQDVSQIEFIEKGNFGEVKRGIWNGEDVAVKMSDFKDEASWSCKIDIYNNASDRHSNILTYYASDVVSRDSTSQLRT